MLKYPATLWSPVATLQGVTANTARLLERLCIKTIFELLTHLPLKIVNRPLIGDLVQCHQGTPVGVHGRIASYTWAPRRARTPSCVQVKVGHQTLHVLYFQSTPQAIEAMLPLGEERVLCGTVEVFMGKHQMTHPDAALKMWQATPWQPHEAHYGLTAGLSQRQLRYLIQLALAKLEPLPEWLESSLVTQKKWPRWDEAFALLHQPTTPQQLALGVAAKERLAFDELAADQLAQRIVKRYEKGPKTRRVICDTAQENIILSAIGFTLTHDQQQALGEIKKDLASSSVMRRLLQGDVGSGKTLVAFLSMLPLVTSAFQCAMLAPTDLLARQHYQTLKPLCGKVGIHVALLTGATKIAERRTIQAQLLSGEIHIIIGTHALLEEEIQCHNLAYMVVDEQHRFGVEQRLALAQKGQDVDVLVMSATPIPRTLQLARFGDLDVSTLKEKPKGRLPIETRLVSLTRVDEVAASLARKLEAGEQIYWVCPLVEDSEKLDLMAAQERFKTLHSIYGDKVALIHGRMKGPEKERIMAAFKEGSVTILVSTTVIEVGIDVARATVMVIEHAERFGLSALHQLRGRVGRSDLPSTCLLLYPQSTGNIAFARLRAMKQSNDGFYLAEQDLKLRGGGERFGVKQSGFPSYMFTDPIIHDHLFDKAAALADTWIAKDPTLVSEQGARLRTLLAVFHKDQAMRLLMGG